MCIQQAIATPPFSTMCESKSTHNGNIPVVLILKSLHNPPLLTFCSQVFVFPISLKCFFKLPSDEKCNFGLIGRGPRTPGENTLGVRKLPYFGGKVEIKSLPTLYDTPMLLNICMSYTVGKLLNPTFQCSEIRN